MECPLFYYHMHPKSGHYFGDIIDGNMILSEIGKLAEKFWQEIPEYFPFVTLDEFVVMPNHVHGIIVIDKPYNGNNKYCDCDDVTIGQKRFQNQGKNTLSSIVGSYKSVVTKHARKIHTDFAWQSRFNDHIIRDNLLHIHINRYIKNNPKNWNKKLDNVDLKVKTKNKKWNDLLK